MSGSQQLSCWIVARAGVSNQALTTTAGFWNPSATSRPPRPKPATMPAWRSRPSQLDSNQIASEETGAVQGFDGKDGVQDPLKVSGRALCGGRVTFDSPLIHTKGIPRSVSASATG